MDFTALSTAAIALISFLIYLNIRSIVAWRSRTRGRPLPPGPKPLPIIGNLFSIPQHQPWVIYRDLCAEYGDILHLRILGQSIVVLGSTSVIYEYLDKRCVNTSDRKQSPMIELTGSSFNLGLLPYGQTWRRHRREFWQHFRPQAALKYRPIQCAFTRRFLKKLMNDPMGLKRHIRYLFAGTMLKIVYNIDIDIASDRVDYLSMVDEALLGPSQGLLAGKFLVEFLPFLRHVPSWLPFASSQRLFKKWQAAGSRLKDTPYYHAKASMSWEERAGQESLQSNSVVGTLLSKLHSMDCDFSEEEEIVKAVGAVALEAGADTTFSTLQSMFLAMSLYPDVLKKAHLELDAVVGPNRLPDFGDQASLVYIQAIVKESLRWHNVLPLGIPHSTTADDELHGYFIPAGTVFIPNTWACLHDSDAYENPEEFCPDRFIKNGRIDTSIRDPFAFVFGYGRRICPGRHFAEAALFVSIALVLHVFDITPPMDDEGLPIKIEPRMTDGILSYLQDCRCTIKPRSTAAAGLVCVFTEDDAV